MRIKRKVSLDNVALREYTEDKKSREQRQITYLLILDTQIAELGDRRMVNYSDQQKIQDVVESHQRPRLEITWFIKEDFF